jgi:hypothetical protein
MEIILGLAIVAFAIIQLRMLEKITKLEHELRALQYEHFSPMYRLPLVSSSSQFDKEFKEACDRIDKRYDNDLSAFFRDVQEKIKK